jgi:hypothetical protein
MAQNVPQPVATGFQPQPAQPEVQQAEPQPQVLLTVTDYHGR